MSMPARDKKLLKKLEKAWRDGLSKGNKHPDKYMYKIREKLDRTKPYKGFSKSKKKADDEMTERIVQRFGSD